MPSSFRGNTLQLGLFAYLSISLITLKQISPSYAWLHYAVSLSEQEKRGRRGIIQVGRNPTNDEEQKDCSRRNDTALQ